MTKKAHITSRPNHQIGDKVLGLCGKEWKVQILWADLPKDYPICRKCVDKALEALTEADQMIQSTRTRMRRITMFADVAMEALDEDLALDLIADDDAALIQEQESRARRKAEKKRAKQTCLCVWNKEQIETVNPDCPIHGDLASSVTEPQESGEE